MKGVGSLIAREITSGERERWNSFIAHCPVGHIFHTFEWGVYKSKQGWRPRRIIIIEDGGRIISALPILERSIPLLGQVLWYLPRGPVVDFSDHDLAKETIRILKDLCAANRVAFARISPDVILDENGTAIIELLNAEGMQPALNRQLHKCTLRVNLQGDLSNILANMEQRTRYAIKVANKRGVQVERGNSEGDLRLFYQLYQQSLKRKGRNFLPFNYFKGMLEVFAPLGMLQIFLAFYEGMPLSGALILTFSTKCWYMFGGSSLEHRRVNAGQLLQWEVIRWAKATGCSVYDLQGISCTPPEKGDPGWGVYLFKRGFGGERVELIGEFDYIASPVVHKFILNWMYPIYKKGRSFLASLRAA